jgi:quinol monooxygenase YgiN
VATFLAHIRVHAGRETEFEAVAAVLWRDTHRTESGVRRYEYWRGQTAGTYYALASFDSYRAFIEHQTSAHHTAASPHLRELIAEIRLEWLDSVSSAGGQPPTEMTPPPADADAATRDYYERQPAIVADWWRSLRDAAG